MADYALIEDLKADLPDSPLFSSTSVVYNSVLARMVSSASWLIDRYVGGWPNYFYPSSTAETRYFSGSGDAIQYIDPAVSITSVSVDETDSGTFTAWTLDTHYSVVPKNYAALSMPIHALKLVSSSGKSFSRFDNNVKVVGVFGYSATPPDDINMACKIQAMRWFMRAKQGYQDGSANPALGEMIYVQELDPDVKMILRPYQIANVVTA